MPTLRNLSVRTKLNTLVGLAIVTMAIIVVVGRHGVQALDATNAKLVLNGKRIATHTLTDMSHDALRADVMSAILATDEAAKAQARADVAEHATAFRKGLAENQQSATEAASSIAIGQFHPLLERYIGEAERMVELGVTNPTAARAAMPTFGELFGQVETALDKVTDLLKSEAKVEQVDGVAVATRNLIVTSVVAGVLLIVLSLLISRSLARRLERAAQLLHAVAERDFTKQLVVDSGDEIGQISTAINQVVDGMRTTLAQVREVAMEVAASSGSLANSSEAISENAQSQASSLEETAAALEELTATVRQNADNARQANQVAVGSREVAEQGGGVVESAVTAMSAINASSRKIADIIATIDEIAFQTNLLALNAAVEAARAGEQGRGFAVVASEVRNLAQRSAQAAKEIKTLIHDSVIKVDGGTALVNQSGRTLHEIVSSVKRVSQIVGDMASASREQASGIDQVNAAVTKMDSATQSYASQTQELSTTADAMRERAERLSALVAQFRLDLDTDISPATIPTTIPIPRVRATTDLGGGHHTASHSQPHAEGWARGTVA